MDTIFNEFDIKLIPTYGLLFTVIAVIIATLHFATNDPKSLTINTYGYILTIAIPLLVILYYAIPAFNSSIGTRKIFGLVFLAVTMTLAAFYFYANMNPTYFEMVGYLSGFLSLSIVLVGLAITFYMMSNYLKSFTGWSGFVVYFIFYIPCLLIDFFKYILKELQMTSQIIYVLFFIEIILMILYIFIPKVITAMSKKVGIVLLEGGSFLDEHKVIGSSSTLKIQPDKLENTSEGVVYNRNYAFSMWVYLNIQANNTSAYTQETPIFDCGNGKPKIVYYNNMDDANKKNKYIVYFTDVKKGPQTYELTLPNQKWNNFVFNYDHNKVDLFINGELVRTFYFNDGDNNNRPKYMPSDKISIGSENGLIGAICNVRYYPYNLSISQIVSNYNLLMYKNPPTFIL